MDHVPYYAHAQAFLDERPRPNLEHLQPSYRLACYDAETGEVFGTFRMYGQNPGRIQWTLPIQIGNKRITVQVLDDWPLEGIGGPYNVINP